MSALTTKELASQADIPVQAIRKLVEAGVLTPESPRRFPAALVTSLPRKLRDLRFVATVTQDSWTRLLDDGLTYTLLGRHAELTATVMRPRNRVAFYVVGSHRFCAIAEMTGRPKRKNVVWPHGVFSYVVPLAPIRVLELENGVPVQGLMTNLDFIRKPASWGQYLRGAIRIVSRNDYRTIADAVAAQPPLT